MEIRVGKYIMKSDFYCMWIEEEYEGKDKKGNVKTYTRRVAGYSMNFDQLMKSFCEHKYRGSGAEDLRDLLKELAQIQEDMEAFRKTALKEDYKRVRQIRKKI